MPKPKRYCEIDHCGKPVHGHGMCAMHYMRLRVHGTTAPISRERPAEGRFFSKVRQDGDCWLWTGALYWTGYGAFRNAEGRTITAHRWSYEFMVGEIPEGLHLDHLCRNRACVNPYHLDPVPQAVNNRRSRAGAVNRAIGYAKTHCKQGHEFAPENIRWVGPERQYRQCRACSREASRRTKQRMREQRLTA